MFLYHCHALIKNIQRINYQLNYNYYYYYYKRILLECCTVKKTSRALNNQKIKSNSVTQFRQISNERLKSDVFSRRLKTDSDGDAVTSDGRLFQRRAAATPKARSPTVTRRVGGMFSSNVDAERSRRWESMSAPRAVLVQGMAKPYHASNGRQAQHAWIRSAVACVTNEGPGAAVWCGRISVLNKRAVQQHSSQTAVCQVDCLPRRPTSHCHNRGVSVPRTPPAIAESAVRLIDKCCGSQAIWWCAKFLQQPLIQETCFEKNETLQHWTIHQHSIILASFPSNNNRSLQKAVTNYLSSCILTGSSQ